MKLIHRLIFLFTITLNLTFAADEDHQLSQIRQDIKILSEVLKKHEGDSFAYDAGYALLGDNMVNAMTKDSLPTQEEKIKKVKELYQVDKETNKLNSIRLTWLGVQLAMAATPSPWPEKLPKCSADEYITVLEELHNGTPLWLLDFTVLEQKEANGKVKLFPFIKMCHLFAIPLPVYTGNSAFNPDHLLPIITPGFFPYCLSAATGKGHILHGGIFKTQAQRTLHDIIHYHTQWIPENHTSTYRTFQSFKIDKPVIDKYLHAARVWRTMAETMDGILNTPELLTKTENARVGVCTYLMMHRGDYTIPSVLGELKEPFTMLQAVKLVAQKSQAEIKTEINRPNDKTQFYTKLCEQDAEDNKRKFTKMIQIKEDPNILHRAYLTYESTVGTKLHRREIYRGGIHHYEHWKIFNRDLGHLLIQKGLWSPANLKKDEIYVLGTAYDMSKVLNIILDCYKTFSMAYEPKGKLHERLKQIKF